MLYSFVTSSYYITLRLAEWSMWCSHFRYSVWIGLLSTMSVASSYSNLVRSASTFSIEVAWFVDASSFTSTTLMVKSRKYGLVPWGFDNGRLDLLYFDKTPLWASSSCVQCGFIFRFNSFSFVKNIYVRMSTCSHFAFTWPLRVSFSCLSTSSEDMTDGVVCIRFD